MSALGVYRYRANVVRGAKKGKLLAPRDQVVTKLEKAKQAISAQLRLC